LSRTTQTLKLYPPHATSTAQACKPRMLSRENPTRRLRPQDCPPAFHSPTHTRLISPPDSTLTREGRGLGRRKLEAALRNSRCTPLSTTLPVKLKMTPPLDVCPLPTCDTERTKTGKPRNISRRLQNSQITRRDPTDSITSIGGIPGSSQRRPIVTAYTGVTSRVSHGRLARRRTRVMTEPTHD
jgi:hypothetical protein